MVRAEVGGEVAEVEELEAWWRGDDLGWGWDQVAAPGRGDAWFGKPTRVVCNRVDELPGAQAVGDGVDGD